MFFGNWKTEGALILHKPLFVCFNGVKSLNCTVMAAKGMTKKTNKSSPKRVKKSSVVKVAKRPIPKISKGSKKGIETLRRIRKRYRGRITSELATVIMEECS